MPRTFPLLAALLCLTSVSVRAADGDIIDVSDTVVAYDAMSGPAYGAVLTLPPGQVNYCPPCMGCAAGAGASEYLVDSSDLCDVSRSLVDLANNSVVSISLDELKVVLDAMTGRIDAQTVLENVQASASVFDAIDAEAVLTVVDSTSALIAARTKQTASSEMLLIEARTKQTAARTKQTAARNNQTASTIDVSARTKQTAARTKQTASDLEEACEMASMVETMARTKQTARRTKQTAARTKQTA